MHAVLWCILIAAMSYVLGGVNGSIVTAHLFYHKDIREYGSKNPGLTNFYRTFGKNAIILVILTDILKAVIPVILAGYIVQGVGTWGSEGERVVFGRIFAGFFAILGHCFPLFYKFKGGKGVLTGGTVIILVDWRVAVIVWGIFLIAAITTRYVSLGSVLAGIGYPIGVFAAGYRDLRIIILALLSGGLVVLRHRDNIMRLIRGEERKFSFSRDKGDKL